MKERGKGDLLFFPIRRGMKKIKSIVCSAFRAEACLPGRLINYDKRQLMIDYSHPISPECLSFIFSHLRDINI